MFQLAIPLAWKVNMSITPCSFRAANRSHEFPVKLTSDQAFFPAPRPGSLQNKQKNKQKLAKQVNKGHLIAHISIYVDVFKTQSHGLNLMINRDPTSGIAIIPSVLSCLKHEPRWRLKVTLAGNRI